MDAADSKRAVLLGILEGGAMCQLFAASYPDRVSKLILMGSYAFARAVAPTIAANANAADQEVVAFYATATVHGIITQPHKPFRYHRVSAGRTRTAHLDAFGIGVGAQLLLPAQ